MSQRKVLGDASDRANLRATPKQSLDLTEASKPIAKTGKGKALDNTPKEPGVAELEEAKENAGQTVGLSTTAPKARKKAATATAPSGSSNKKRKSGASLEDDIAAYRQDLCDVDVDDMSIDMDCDKVRGLINQLIDSGIMRKGEFCAATGLSNANVNAFLAKEGANGGAKCAAYKPAWRFFKRREVRGLEMPSVEKRQKLDAVKEAEKVGGTGSRSRAKTTISAASLLDISNVHLEGEEDDSVEVYDTCDEVRRKIKAHLGKTPGLTQAQFCRELYAQLGAPKCKAIQASQLANFRGGKGARTGAKSTVFYAAYVYFEKLRIAQGKPKSAHRLEMEDIWGYQGGFDLDVDHTTR